MSWDKNTIRDTKIDNTIEVLKESFPESYLSLL